MIPDPSRRPPLPQRHPSPALVRTIEDEQADALAEEFAPFQVWTDFRPRTDGGEHWHARLPGWTADKIVSASDATGMRDALIRYRREHPEES